MKKRNTTPKNPTERVRRERDPIPWKYCLLTLVCGLFLVVGFFSAARQHFSAIDFGMKNADLRREKEKLEADQRRFFLSREVSLSPGEIKKAAKKIGLQELTAENIEVMKPKKLVEKSASEKAMMEIAKKAFSDKSSDDKPAKENKIEKTVAVTKSKPTADTKAKPKTTSTPAARQTTAKTAKK